MWLWPSEHFLSFSGIMLEEKQMIEVFQKSLFEQLLVSIWEIDGCKRRLNYGNVLSLLICWVWLYNIKTVSSRSLWFSWVIHGFSMLHSLSVSLLFPSLTQPHSPSSSSLPLTVSLNPTSKLCHVMYFLPFFSSFVALSFSLPVLISSTSCLFLPFSVACFSLLVNGVHTVLQQQIPFCGCCFQLAFVITHFISSLSFLENHQTPESQSEGSFCPVLGE